MNWFGHVMTQTDVNMTCNNHRLIIDYKLTLKAATLIFISERGSVISSAKEGKSGFIYNFGKELISFFGRAIVRAFHESPERISLTSHV